MPYYIEALDKENSEAIRANVRPAHLEYLKSQQHLLLACGALLDDEGQKAFGSVYLVDVDTREEAEKLLHADPFYQAEVFANIKIIRWRKTFLDKKSYL